MSGTDGRSCPVFPRTWQDQGPIEKTGQVLACPGTLRLAWDIVPLAPFRDRYCFGECCLFFHFLGQKFTKEGAWGCTCPMNHQWL